MVGNRFVQALQVGRGGGGRVRGNEKEIGSLKKCTAHVNYRSMYVVELFIAIQRLSLLY